MITYRRVARPAGKLVPEKTEDKYFELSMDQTRKSRQKFQPLIQRQSEFIFCSHLILTHGTTNNEVRINNLRIDETI